MIFVRQIVSFACVFLLLLHSACSGLKRYTPTPEVKVALILSSGDYVGHILRGDQTRLEGMVIWADYLDDGRKGLNKVGVFEQMRMVRELWPDLTTSPLVDLDLKSIDASETEAEVILQRINSPSSPEIRLLFRWAGAGWLVADDSIFGREGLIAETARERQKLSQS